MPKKEIVDCLFIFLTYLLISALCLSSNTYVLSFSLSLILAFILSGFINFSHECLHGHVFRCKKKNRVAGMIACTFLITNFDHYKNHHLLHHKHIGTDLDTEDTSTFSSIKSYLYHLLTPTFSIKNLRICFVESWQILTFQQKIGVQSQSSFFVTFWFLACVGLTYFFPAPVLFSYWIPLYIANALIFFWGLPEHYQCDESKDPYSNTRSIKSNFIVRYFQWNANWHAHHHRYPGTPSRLLTSKYPDHSQNLKYLETSYIAWHGKIIKGLIKL